MKSALFIALEEWRYWFRSGLTLAVITIFAVVLISVSLLTALRIESENAERTHHQNEAEQTFLSQPDRHPHRMVHYGHYVFRAPVPLALFDPGLDSITGQSMFLEGHRQNSATFSESRASAYLGSFSWLTPALIYQLFAPLLIILLGHGAIVRERECGTLWPMLAQGLNSQVLLAGKALALLAFIGLLLLPLVFSALLAVSRGETFGAAVSLIGVYFLYLSIWAASSLLVSTLVNTRSTALASLASAWLALSLVGPALAVNAASNSAPLVGKIESELTMLSEESLSDGHNANDSAFDQLRADLLEQYGVDKVEDLGVNIRGVVAQKAEEHLTEIMNIYAEDRMAKEDLQANWLTNFGWLTPKLAITSASRTISGTDLPHYHRFLRQAEEIRFDFVQGLNQVHTEQLSYADDINRSRDEASSLRTRMDASNWQVLDEYQFEASNTSTRLTNAGNSVVMLLAWFVAISASLLWAGGRLKP